MGSIATAPIVSAHRAIGRVNASVSRLQAAAARSAPRRACSNHAIWFETAWRAMQLSDSVGYAAAILTTISFVPQAWHTWKTRHAGGVSLGMLCLYTLGVALWFCYGLVLNAWPVIVANAITLVLALFILLMKLRFDR